MASELYEPVFYKLVEDTPGAEGPVFTPDGRFFCVAPWVVDTNGTPAGEILQVDLDKNSKKVLVAPVVDGHGGRPAGLQCDKQNNLWVADMRLGILKVALDGTMTQISKVDEKGETMQGCNDCIFDYDGNLWVTAPAGNIAPDTFRRSFDEPFGAVYCLTKSGQVKKVAGGYLFSNGLAVKHKDNTPDLLIVAETMTQSLWAYDILGPGEICNKRLWGKLPGTGMSGPDGMDFDEAGNLLVANWGQGHLEVFGPNGGTPLSRIKCPFSKPTNIHFKPDSTICYITEQTNNSVWSFQWKYKGRKEYCQL